MSEAISQLFQGSDPSAALASLTEQVRREPADAKHRIFLFQLLAFLGQWDRALTQLNVSGELDAGALGMVEVYRTALASEALRADVFAGRRAPLVFGDPNRWMALLLESLRVSSQGALSQASDLRGEAFDLAPTSSGTINGEPFSWIADGDTRLGPVIEVIMNGNYYWVPWEYVAQVKIDAPEDLRDLVWLPAEFKWQNGGETYGLIPARYPGSVSGADIDLVTGRRTEWLEQEEGGYIGLGQRELNTDAGEYPLLEVRSIEVHALGDNDQASDA